MKKLLLLIVALLATAGFAYGAVSIDFAKTDNFRNVPATGLKVGDTFAITNIDPKVFSPGELKDAMGTIWAKKLSAVYPYGGKTTPGRGTATFKVTAIPQAAAPIKPPVPERPSKLPPQPKEVEPIPLLPPPVPERPFKLPPQPTEVEPIPLLPPPVPERPSKLPPQPTEVEPIPLLPPPVPERPGKLPPQPTEVEPIPLVPIPTKPAVPERPGKLAPAPKEVEPIPLVPEREIKPEIKPLVLPKPQALPEPFEPIAENINPDQAKAAVAPLVEAWKLLPQQFGLDFEVYFQGGYIFFMPPGKQMESNLYLHADSYKYAPEEYKKEIAEKLVQNYKIHLMPSEATKYTEIVKTILNALKNNPDLQKIIQVFKVRPPLLPIQFSSGKIMARVVFYIITGKDDVQKALNILFNALKNIKGSGIRPRFNAKVNDLIWVAQGDGDFKGGKDYKEYYEEPGQYYYRNNFTGTEENYHLISPITGKELVD